MKNSRKIYSLIFLLKLDLTPFLGNPLEAYLLIFHNSVNRCVKVDLNSTLMTGKPVNAFIYRTLKTFLIIRIVGNEYFEMSVTCLNMFLLIYHDWIRSKNSKLVELSYFLNKLNFF